MPTPTYRYCKRCLQVRMHEVSPESEGIVLICGWCMHRRAVEDK